MARPTVIDADGHVFEPDGLWERYLPPALHDRRPRLVLDDRGTTRYLLDGHLVPPGTGVGAWVPEGIEAASVKRDGAMDPRLRLADMDTEGIDVAVLYGTASLGFWGITDRELAGGVLPRLQRLARRLLRDRPRPPEGHARAPARRPRRRARRSPPRRHRPRLRVADRPLLRR